MKELQNIKEMFDTLLSHFDEAGIKNNTYDEWVERTKRREPQQSKDNLNAIIDSVEEQ